MHVVRNSDHNLACDNPEELARVIIGDLKGTITHKFDIKLEMYYLDLDLMDEVSNESPEKQKLDQIVIHPYNNDD